MGLAVSCGKDEERELFPAIREGDLQHVKLLINAKPKLVHSALSYNKLSPLHYAASHGQADVLALLLAQDAQVNAVNHYKQTPLMLACKNGRLFCVERLVEWGAAILMFDSPNGRTCLHYAAKTGHLDCLQVILVAGKLMPVASTWGFSRLVNVRDDSGATPLHLAARSSHPAVVRLLLDNGALVCATTTGSDSNSGSCCGTTPLHLAARGGSTECIKELLSWGADRNPRDSKGHTPYCLALKYNNTACAALLNPDSAAPLVWPSPWKFLSELDPEAKRLLEVALVEANNAWEKKICGETNTAAISTEEMCETGDILDKELCCICFDNACAIQVQDCGHQMCAGCTLALCCHSKPNRAMPNSPPPVCPFCRRKIGQLKLVCKEETLGTEVKNSEKNNPDKLKRVGEASSSNFKGLVVKGPSRLLSSKGSGSFADTELLKECSSQELCTSVSV